jgi:hypothetical protein
VTDRTKRRPIDRTQACDIVNVTEGRNSCMAVARYFAGGGGGGVIRRRLSSLVCIDSLLSSP